MDGVTIPAADLPTIVAALDALFDARMQPHTWPLARTDETWRKPLYALYMQATGQLIANIANTRRAS